MTANMKAALGVFDPDKAGSETPERLRARVQELDAAVKDAERTVVALTEIHRAAERQLEAQKEKLEAAIRPLRVLDMASGHEPHWLTKDFNVLYAAALAFSEACLGRGDGKPFEPHLALQAQLERLRPAFRDTEEVRAILRKRGP